jgi:amino-acid N-acetyltransferase
VTGAVELAAVQVECGLARSRVEAALAKALRSGGASHGRSTIGVDVIGGNGFVSGRPVGVLDGVDTGFSGHTRLVDAGKIARHLDNGEIVLLNALAYSPSGETFNVRTEEVAVRAAPALLASKLIFVTAGHELAWKNSDGSFAGVSGHRVASLRLDDARKLLGRRSELDSEDASSAAHQLLDLTAWCVDALEQGVTRAHLVAPTDGALLRELYTRDGAGTLISRDIYEGIRGATLGDIDSLLSLVAPLEADGTLLPRARPKLEDEVHRGCYYVLVRDDLPIACASLKRLDAAGTHAELGCLVVATNYRRQSKGDALLSYLERVAIASGVRQLFALSTKTMHWFVERGFNQVELDALPQERQDIYDKSRRPKVYRKTLKADRDVDVEDAFWTRRHANDQLEFEVPSS